MRDLTIGKLQSLRTGPRLTPALSLSRLQPRVIRVNRRLETRYFELMYSHYDRPPALYAVSTSMLVTSVTCVTSRVLPRK